MNGDALKKVRPGDRLTIPARAYNAFIDAALALRGHEQDRKRQARPDHRQADIIWIRNESGNDRERFEVLGLDEPIVLPEDNLRAFKNRLAFKGVEPDPAQHRGRFAVLLEPLKAGSIGAALLSGVTVARVHIKDDEHGFADILEPYDEEGVDPPDPFILYSTSGGSGHGGEAQILWKEEGTGEKWAVLRLGAGAAGTFPARITDVAHVAIDHEDYGKYAWEQVRWIPGDQEAGEWQTVEGGRSGAISAPTHAREINGRPMVAPGTIVLMSATSGGHFFSMDSAPTYEDLGELADEQYQTTDFDHDDGGGPTSKWFDRDHVHHGGPTSRYDPQGQIVPMPGAHIEGWPRAWFARLVNFLRNADQEVDDPNSEGFEPEHHDNLIEMDRRVLHGDPAGHLQWVGPSTGQGESELDGVPPKLLVRHKEPGATDCEVQFSLSHGSASGTLKFDEKGHLADCGNVSLTLSTTTVQVVTDVRVSGNEIQVKKRSLTVLGAGEPGDWQTIHTGTECP